MKNYDTRKIRKSMKKNLDSNRYEHTLGVAYTACSLAMRYGENINNAEIAGLLHDCAKCIDNDTKISICEKHHISMTESELLNPYLLHAKVGSFIAMKKYKIQDLDIINAILNHNTGRPGMSLLEKIIYVADYIEPHRKKIENLDKIRLLAFQDLDAALTLILKDTLQYLNQKNVVIDPMTEKTYEYYCNMEKEENTIC